MNFGGRGRSCQYYLQFGLQSQKCEWIGLNKAVDFKGSVRSQPCNLGFLAKLKKDDVVKIRLFNGIRCKVQKGTFKQNMSMAKLGLIKL